jgi:hypothetical protein
MEPLVLLMVRCVRAGADFLKRGFKQITGSPRGLFCQNLISDLILELSVEHICISWPEMCLLCDMQVLVP